ncbi:MAG: hypothetical protein HYZ74_05925 [Elusimicrobia bacterium]|nr:hypothetical protein [Elusimicrobiota bacterium]
MEYPSYPTTTGPRLYWSAIFAGTAMSLATMACLSVLGAAIGFMTVPGASAPVSGIAKGLGIGGGLWLLLSGVVSFYVGGWFASRLSNSGRPADGVIYGLVSWATATLVVGFLFTTALGSALGAAMGGAGDAAAPIAAGQTAGAVGLFGFLMMVLEACAAALGGHNGARLYRPVPIGEYTPRHRHAVASRES